MRPRRAAIRILGGPRRGLRNRTQSPPGSGGLWVVVGPPRRRFSTRRRGAARPGRRAGVTELWAEAVAGWAAWCRSAGHSELSIHERSYVLRQFAAAAGVGPWQVTL